MSLKEILKKFQPITLGILLTGFFMFFEVTSNPELSIIRERLNNLFYDLRTRFNLHDSDSKLNSQTVIVDIDDKSLQALGRWPWPRDVLAELVDNLKKDGALVIALDIVFPEEEKNIVDFFMESINPSALNKATLEDLNKSKPIFAHDTILSNSINSRDIVMGYILTPGIHESVGELPNPLEVLSPAQADRIFVREMRGYIGINPTLLKATRNSGFVTTLSDNDGVIRHYPVVLRYKNGIYPSIALSAVAEYLLMDKIQLNWMQTGENYSLASVDAGHINVPTDGSGQVLIPYHGFSFSHSYISAVDVLHGNFDKNLVKNKIVFIGTSALGLGDLHSTPFETSFPGVEVHATIADTFLSDSFPYKPDWALGAQIILIVFIGLTLSFSMPFVPVLAEILIPAVSIFIFIFFNDWLWDEHHIYLSSFSSVLLIVGIGIINSAYSLLFESSKRIQLKQMFGQYVPSEHVDKMLNSPKDYSFEGESREMSVLFADIRNFTKISEPMDPASLKKFLNDYFTPMTKVIFEHGGTIDKYVGDMIMAFWGAPLENKNHALDSVKAGFEMLRITNEMQPYFKEFGIDSLKIGIGINTGKMNVGDMGSIYRRSYTVLGDSVNLSSRLESATKFYGTNFIISETTLLQCQGQILARHLDKVKVKGKYKAINIYEPLCFRKDITPELHDELFLFTEAQKHYFLAEWDEALKCFEKLHLQKPTDKLYPLYINRIKDLKAAGIKAPWDGCFVKDEK